MFHPYIYLWEPINRLRDIQESRDYFELGPKHPRNVSKKFRKITPTVQEITLYWPNFIKEVSQLKD